MHRVSCLVALVLCGWLATGCASSHKKALQGGMYGAGGARIGIHDQVTAARASDGVFSIFPAAPGKRKCQIPLEGGAISTSRRAFLGVCRTSVRPGPPAIVVFSERW